MKKKIALLCVSCAAAILAMISMFVFGIRLNVGVSSVWNGMYKDNNLYLNMSDMLYSWKDIDKVKAVSDLYQTLPRTKYLVEGESISGIVAILFIFSALFFVAGSFFFKKNYRIANSFLLAGAWFSTVGLIAAVVAQMYGNIYLVLIMNNAEKHAQGYWDMSDAEQDAFHNAYTSSIEVGMFVGSLVLIAAGWLGVIITKSLRIDLPKNKDRYLSQDFALKSDDKNYKKMYSEANMASKIAESEKSEEEKELERQIRIAKLKAQLDELEKQDKKKEK